MKGKRVARWEESSVLNERLIVFYLRYLSHSTHLNEIDWTC